MSILPETEYPIYTTILPVSKQEIKFRPYKVKEQKLLLMEKESGDQRSLINTINQIINNCVQSKINVYELPITDSEFLFYQIRARSESEIINLRYRCENTLESGEICNNSMSYRFNLLTDIEVTPGVDPVVELDEITTVKMKYQKLEYSKFDEIENPTPQELFEEIAKQIDFIATKDSVYTTADVPKQQIIDWLGDLSVDKYAKIENFTLNEPKLHKNIKITCSKCNMEHHIEVGDLYDFFM